MNTDNWLSSINSKVARIGGDGLVVLATGDTMVDVSERVWGRGELTSGSKLVYKENYEIWAYKPPAPRKVSGRGKPDAQGKSAKIKGGWHPTYLSFKAQQGRANLPFELSGDLRLDYLGGVRATPVADGELACTVSLSGVNVGKWKGLTEKKGEFLALSENERENHFDRLREAWSNILRA